METTPTTAAERLASLAPFIGNLVAELEPLQLLHNEALWLANVTGDPAHEAESGRLDATIRRILARPEPYAHARGLLEAGGVDDPQLQRQLVLLVHSFRAHQIPPETIDRMVQLEKSLENRFNHFRADLNGRRVADNELRDVLRTSSDSAERRSVWEASKQIGAQVEGDLLELVRIRNQAARSLGFDNYYSMMLELDELREDELFALLAGLEEGTRPLFHLYKRDLDEALARRYGVAPPDLQPWHYMDPFFQEAPSADYSLDPWFQDRSLPDLSREFFGALGFDIRNALERADLYERPGKSQHAFCLSVDRAEDVRVLCNLRSNEFWMSTLLHEFGHAVYDLEIDRSLPYLLRAPAHTLTTEASAMLFGRLSKNAAWLERYAGMPAAEAERAGRSIERAIRTQLLVQTRWCLVMCHMERELYRRPEQDLDALWWELAGAFQGLRRPEGRKAPDWASKIHFSVAPVYYHNYMLGEVMASQLQAHLMDRVVGPADPTWRRYVSSPEVGAWLTERLYRPGKSVDWREAVRRSTGRPLSADSFVADLEPV